MRLSKLVAIPLILCGLWSSTAKAQKLKNFLENKDSSFTWLGVDFTQARLIGDAGADAADIVARHFAGINQVVVNEPKKYDVSGAFHHSKVNYAITTVNKRNEGTNKDLLKSDNPEDFNHLKPEDIQKLVKGFDFSDKKGIGVLFVMEAMSKAEKAAAMYVTIVDMDTRRVLLTERMTGKAKGFGFRNYWAFSVHDVMDDFSSDYNKIKQKYADAVDPVEETAPKKEGKTAVATKGTKAAKKKG
ncbi:hypothetical protein [Chitinophaga nivalis]|uniref:Uncharacterized protein n=1 Tax=Chitinophaga nivalis TaxID=2991709 RepID=A0ABT3IG81_9BACT|nr:hypothetical protein [Chitinophaga nivalis]MCW3467539.1 hypothetical protein [Chitinophaga nivalis]MCW3482769.1 hypothetical protein [Chitinophaga nivalis]